MVENIEEEILQKLKQLESATKDYEHKNNVCNKFISEHKDIVKSLEVGARQYELLHIIIQRNCNKVTDLAKYLDLSKSSLSIIISKMVESEFLKKEYDTTEDSRNVILEVTEKGQESYYLLKNMQCSELVKFLKGLNQEERELFDKAIKSLMETFSIFGIIPIKSDNTNEEVADIIFQNLFILKMPFEKFFREVKNNLKDKITLTEKEIKILGYLSKVKSSTPTEIANNFNSSESTMSLQLKQLLKKAHITKTKSIMDSRKNLFSITENGLKTVEVEFELLQNEFINSLKIISFEDKKNILNGLNDLMFLFKLLAEKRNA